MSTLLGLLQLDITQEYIVDRIETNIEKSYHAELSVGELDGFLPFQLSMQDVVLTNTDTVGVDTLATIKTLNSKIDLWGLLQNRITITGFSMDQPNVWVQSDRKGRTRFLKSRKKKATRKDSSSGSSWFGRVEVFAPTMEVKDGGIYLHSVTPKNQIGNLPQSFAITDINANFFVDWNERQRYLDIETFSAKPQGLGVNDISFSGQVYNDDRYLEFNSFYINLDDSRIILNGEIDGVNILKPDFTNQLLQSRYNLWVRSERLHPKDLRDIIPELPKTDALFTLDVEAEGTTDSLGVNYASVGLGESRISLNGLFKELETKKAFSYDISLDELKLRKRDINKLSSSLSAPQYQALENLRASGKAAGTLDSVAVDLKFESPLGKLAMKGRSDLTAPYGYTGFMEASNLDISPLVPTTFDTTSLNFNVTLEGHGITLKKAKSDFSASFRDSFVDHVPIQELEVTSSLSNNIWKHNFQYRNEDEKLSGSGSVDFSEKLHSLVVNGSADNIDLAKLFNNSSVASTQLNFDYKAEVEDLRIDQLHGRANLDIRPSVVGADSIRAHQFYMDLNDIDKENRSLRLTSSLFDMNLSGDIEPKVVLSHTKLWVPFIQRQFQKEVLLDTAIVTETPQQEVPAKSIVLEGNITAKDLTLIKRYIPSFPTINTDSEISFSANTDGTRLLLSAEIQADTLQYNQFNFSDARTQMTASFRRDRSFKEFSTVDLQANVGVLKTPSLDMDSLGVSLAVKQDSIQYEQYVGNISDNAEFNMVLNSSLSDSTISVSIPEFYVGNNKYAWTNEHQPAFSYHRNGGIRFQDFSFQNRNEYFRLEGMLSKNRTDSLTYILRDIKLGRISELINGKINFSGVLNGTLVTRSLTRSPTIQGNLDVEKFHLNDRLVGDLAFDSEYNSAKDQFDTQIDIETDSLKYSDYLASNDGVGQNIRLDGYFVTPNPEIKQDTVFYFDADFKQIDMWIIPLIVDKVFKNMEGQAFGDGYITGNLDDFDFNANFDTENVFAKPRFVNTNYFVSGPVEFDRHKGVVLDSLQVMDTKGGTGIVTGVVDLNDFDPITYLDLTLDMQRLQFLNNTIDPDVPFFGNVSGTGVVRLTGSNTDLFMRTENPVRLTSDSEVSIPLLEETELSENSKFIQFVNSFDQPKETAENGTTVSPAQMDDEQLERALENMTFSERFDLDLQFNAPENVTVNLIFDPVLGEVLTAEGTGQMRISMQDQDVQMFGRYNINGGDYQFVTGEIISRNLELESGGTIAWEGPPDNARLDISAVYRARPNIATLTSETTLESQNQRNGQRVPIELILEINGTLNSVENNYYFRLPSSIDLSSNSTLQYTINQINRDEEQKLFQATSILLSGQFIPTEGTGSATASLSQNLTRGATVLNPLISNQVISPLLSNQINALLNSDVNRLDVDFNLNAYNEVDLGIALRLYNDRLILRREGQITGGGSQQSLSDRIGDINATYRIQRGLSLTAFHRQDQVLNSLSTGGSQAGDVTPSVDGIGLESQVQFNSWKELVGRIKDFFNSIFGTKKDKDEGNKKKLLNTSELSEEEK
ncbi:translocation/assembly module TamB domain-containing protein [Fodinibius saliphilus]|uniref:translocation/assembly module TamB domain-containing protein n=1 Tax=Fodinibius saliphilus TaxID=1920650 RepID=UPI001108D1DF|nr:hypothetical protein [Fodinibius saliphilus]